MQPYEKNPGPLNPQKLRDKRKGGEGGIKLGDSRNNLVRHLQQMLLAKEYSLGDYGPNKDGVDGKFGALTKKAVEKFQRDKNNRDWDRKPLVDDGKVGEKTAFALNVSLINKWYPSYKYVRKKDRGTYSAVNPHKDSKISFNSLKARPVRIRLLVKHTPIKILSIDGTRSRDGRIFAQHLLRLGESKGRFKIENLADSALGNRVIAPYLTKKSNRNLSLDIQKRGKEVIAID